MGLRGGRRFYGQLDEHDRGYDLRHCLRCGALRAIAAALLIDFSNTYKHFSVGGLSLVILVSTADVTRHVVLLDMF